MTTTILARVRRVLRGHSDRALVVAVNETGLEQKIEVPLEAVQGVTDSGEHVLMLTWSIHALPPVLAPPPASTSTAAPAEPPVTQAADVTPATPRSVDEQFTALMSRFTPAPPSSASPSSSDPAGPVPRPAEQLAALLGIGRAPS